MFAPGNITNHSESLEELQAQIYGFTASLNMELALREVRPPNYCLKKAIGLIKVLASSMNTLALRQLKKKHLQLEEIFR